MAFSFTKNPRIFCKCKCHCWVWRMVDSLYHSSRKIPERCENSFVNYRINYQKLCDLMRQITKEMNWPIELIGMQYSSTIPTLTDRWIKSFSNQYKQCFDFKCKLQEIYTSNECLNNYRYGCIRHVHACDLNLCYCWSGPLSQCFAENGYFEIDHNFDVTMTAYWECWNLFWHVWKRETPSYIIVSIRCTRGFLFKFIGVVITPLGRRVTKIGLVRRGLS